MSENGYESCRVPGEAGETDTFRLSGSCPKRKNGKPDGRKNRRSFSEWMAVCLDVPSDILDGGFRLDWRGRHTLTVHGCRRINAYSPEEIRLSLHKGELCIDGQRLICTSYLAGAVGIEGDIRGVRWSDSGSEREGTP